MSSLFRSLPPNDVRPWRAALTALALAGLPVTVFSAEPTATAALVRQYCLDCHDGATNKGKLNFETLDPAHPAAHATTWEAVVSKLEHRQMPPVGEPRPDEATYRGATTALIAQLDQAAAARPQPGRSDTFRRLNRTEYQNAIRDLLGVNIDATALLPNDEPSHGFDNVAVGNLSPTLLDRYVSAAQKIARLAVGTPRKSPGGDTFRVRPDVTQAEHVEGLPLEPAINIPIDSTNVTIGADGTVSATQAGQHTPTQLGQIQLVNFPN
ncbi:MAG: DUF1587 domain-containing protein, partial [Verrucomicrobiota bacterium]